MNYHRVLLALGLTCSALVGPILAQSPIPVSVKTATFLDDPSQNLVQGTVAELVKRLQDTNPTTQQNARESLVNESRNGNGNVSPAYTNAYVDQVATQLTPILTGQGDIRVKLNAAIVIARIADITSSTHLDKVVTLLLDKEQPEALQLWGIQAARPILPVLVQIHQDKVVQALADRIVAIAMQRGGGPMIEEAYRALTPSDGKAAAALVDDVLLLADWRAVQYGASLPDDPGAETKPILFLTANADVIKSSTITPAQHVAIMQLVCTLCTRIAPLADNPMTDRAVVGQLHDLFSTAAGGVFFTANTLGEVQAAQTAQQIGKSANLIASPLGPLAKQLCGAIKQMNGYEKVVESKAILPATAPVMGP